MVCFDNVPFINMLTAGSCTTVLLFGKQIHFLKCCIFGESHQILVTWFLIFGSSLHCAGKCMANLYAAYIAGARQILRNNRSLNCQLISNSIIQIHLFCLVRYYAGFTLIVFSSYGRKRRRTRFLSDKNNQFLFSSVRLHVFECMIQTTNI